MEELFNEVKNAVEYTALSAVSAISTLASGVAPLAPTQAFHIGHDICRTISDMLEDLR